MDAFSRSTQESDNEDALKCDSLARIPTSTRIRRGLYFEEQGKVDVKNLGVIEQKDLMERLVRIAQEDNGKFLLKIKERIDRVGIDLPTVEVRFEQLRVRCEAYDSSRALPTMFNFTANILEGFLTNLHIVPSRKKLVSILHDLNGIIKAGRMTLLLGPPSSGKTTLLKALAGRVDQELRVLGKVEYNGHEMDEFIAQRTSAYIGQEDLHLGELTVRETLAFSARCQGVGTGYELLAELLRREKEANIKPDPDLDIFMKASSIQGQKASVMTDYIIKILGLETCADTMIGNEMLRGISGGEKKRVTIDGVIVYQGPRENVLEFFESMGFRCPERKEVADFLQEVTSRKDQQQYWFHRDKPHSFVSVEEFSEAFWSCEIGRKLWDDLSVPFDKAKSHPSALTTNTYGLNKVEVLKACISREYLLMKRNSPVYKFRMMQLLVMGIISMTLFLRIKMSKNTITDGVIYMGALFFSLVTLIFSGFSEMALSVIKLPVFYKQRDLLFFPAWSYSLPAWVLRIPITFFDVAIWVLPTYYTIGFDSDAIRFFRQFFLLICVNQMACGLFRLMGSLGRNMTFANSFATCILLTFFVFGGFILSREDIRKWWRWGYWLSPVMYGQNAIAVNEFNGKSWAHVGTSVLKYQGLFSEAYWYWIGVAVSIGYVCLFNFLDILALTYLNPLAKFHAVFSQEILAEKSISADSPNEKRGMILPFEPLVMTFEGIHYAVDMPQSMKSHHGVEEGRLEILKDINGAFRPGVLTALMGVTGAGKTSLMDVLSGRKTSGYVEGKITISGYPKKQETFARIAGYCEQTDIHSPYVTIYESLQYSAWLRLPLEVDPATREMFIQEVMELVELNQIKGGLVNGLSSEQRKRLTIAVELVANPSIIFMDEPTSGLDARAAAIVMRTVRNTVDTGRTVVCTIHQPSIDIFDSFDELMLLQRGGEAIYVGPLGQQCSVLIQYFENIAGVDEIKDGYNPATWMMEVTSVAKEAALGVDFAQLYKTSELFRRNKAMIVEMSKLVPGSKDLNFPTHYSRCFFTQCKACLWKQHLSYSRNPSYIVVRLIFTTFIALMLGTVFWDLGSKRKKALDIFHAMGCMYAAVLYLGVQNATSVQPVIAFERTVFYRERGAGMYSALPYALAQVLIELPHLLIQTLIYGLIVYAMIGFEWTAAKFFWFFFFTYFTLLYFTLYGMMTIAATPNDSIAAIVSSAFYGLWELFSGFIVPYTRIPVWWRWYSYVCPTAWTLYGLIASQFGDLQDKLDTGETVEQYIRNYFGFRHDFVGYVAIIIVGIAVLFGFIYAFSIRAFNFQTR